MKKLIALLLILSMLLASGCQNTDPGNVDSPDTEITNIGESTDNETDASSDEADTIESDDISSDNNGLNAAVGEPDNSETIETFLLSYVSQLDSDGNVVYITSYTYDEYGNVTECVQTVDNDFESWTYEYDANGNVISEMYFMNDSLTEYYEYSYDSESRLLSSRVYNSDGSVNYEYNGGNFDTKYDNEGKMVENKYYVGEEKYDIETFEYNEFGFETRRHLVSPEGMLISYSEQKYDEQGRRTLVSYTNTENSSYNYSLTTTYVTHNDNKTTATTRRTGTDVLVETEVFDADGNLLEYYVYDENGILYNKHVYEVSYDDLGNVQKIQTTTDVDGNEVMNITATYSPGGAEIGYSIIEYTYYEDGTRHVTESLSSNYTVGTSDFSYSVDKVDGEIFSESLVEYDLDGNVLNYRVTYGENVHEEIYEYDENGNLLSTMRYVDGEIIAEQYYEYIPAEIIAN